MKESYLWSTLKEKLNLEQHGIHWSRIENVAGTGIPDVEGCCRGKQVWVELKMFHGKQLSIRTSQVAWQMKRIKAGGRVFFIARRGDELLVYTSRAILEYVTAPGNAKLGPDQKSLLFSPPDALALLKLSKPFDWTQVKEVLFP